MKDFSVTIKAEPWSKTQFERGQTVTLGSNKLLVVGEDDVYLHTFVIFGENFYRGSY